MVSFDRNAVSPKPRSHGVTVRKPAAFSAGATFPYVVASSGQPCKSKTGAPSSGPPVSYAIRSSGVVTNWGMTPIVTHDGDQDYRRLRAGLRGRMRAGN